MRAFQCMTKMQNELALFKKRERKKERKPLKNRGEKIKMTFGT